MIYLASKSPRRAELLRQINVPFELLLPDASEDAEALEATIKHEGPAQYVERVTRDKLAAACARFVKRNEQATLASDPTSASHPTLPYFPILTSDTTVAIGGTILGKPVSTNDAGEMLDRLSGRTHRVITAVALAKGAHHQHRKVIVQTSRVTFARIPRSWIDHYISTPEPFDKAGGYGIQGSISAFVRRIDGSYSGIMGLPLHETAKLLGKNK